MYRIQGGGGRGYNETGSAKKKGTHRQGGSCLTPLSEKGGGAKNKGKRDRISERPALLITCPKGEIDDQQKLHSGKTVID